MPDLKFSTSEIRLATATLAAIATLLPLAYFLYPAQTQDSTEHVNTFNKFIKSYSTLRPQALTTSATYDFTHVSLPTDLNLPTRTLYPFREHAETVFSVFSAFEVTPLEDGNGGDAVHFSRDTDTVVAHCKMGGKVNGESEMGTKLIDAGISEWWTEGVLFVKLSKDGKRVEGVREFMHSKKAEELQIRLDGVLSE
ncbi:hypothetical protein EJ02DRAFT_198480 [Clathrospora elynae]|uniref:Uncharacterized protein n=1 Tax=Clathrospora elynae TaxID=706981 RepID=A0A6A5T2K2_9PLEO|nr:hypothetical protein EJ02DRAFT_198480 [Clathrospora elynae]